MKEGTRFLYSNFYLFISFLEISANGVALNGGWMLVNKKHALKSGKIERTWRKTATISRGMMKIYTYFNATNENELINLTYIYGYIFFFSLSFFWPILLIFQIWLLNGIMCQSGRRELPTLFNTRQKFILAPAFRQQSIHHRSPLLLRKNFYK